MTEEELIQYTRTELNKRINEVVEYEVDIADLEHVPGLANKKIRFGDTIKIKDTKFNPPLYLEARVHTQERNIIDQSQKRVELGDFIEYTEEEVQAIWQQLQAEIRRKVSIVDLIEYTYDKITIDNKDEYVFEEGKTFAELIGVDAKDHADIVAIDAENNAKIYAEDRSAEALLDAMIYAVSQEAYDNKMQEIADDLADRTTIEYVDGQLVDKANVGDVYTIEEVDTRLLNYVGIIEYETDMDGVVQTLSNHNTLIAQNEEAIGFKANQTDLDAVADTVSDHSAQMIIMADEISQRVTRTEFNNLQIGARNLLLNSGVPIEGTDYLVGQWSLSEDFITGETYTMVLEGDCEEPPTFRIWQNGGSNARSTFERVEGTNYWVASFVSVETTEAGRRSVRVYCAPNSAPSPWNVDWICLYRGNVKPPLDWTPAPEDIEYRMSHAETEIIQNAEAIESRATRTELDAVESRVSTAESSISQQAEQIELRVTKTEFVDSLSTVNAGSGESRFESIGHLIFSGGMVELPNSLRDALGNSDEATIEAWIKLDSNSPSTGNAGLWSFTGHNDSNGNLYPYSNSRIYLNTFRTNRIGPIYYDEFNFDLTDWHLLTVSTKEGSNGWNVYLNGVLIRSTSGQSSISLDYETLMFGRNSNRTLRGKVGEFRLWSSALSQEEVISNMNRSFTAIPSNMLGLWRKMNDSGNLLIDETGNGYDGIVVGSVTYQESVGLRVTNAESEITQLATEIDLKVSEDDFNGNEIIGRINLTSTTARIQAENIELVGAVSVLSDITGDLGTINAGDINGVNISGSEFTSSYFDPNDNSGEHMWLSEARLEMARISSGGVQEGIVSYRATGISFQSSPQVPEFEIDAFRVKFTGDVLVDGGSVESIVSQGSNADGRWIRYSSGKQEVWCNPVSMNATVSSGNIFRSDTEFVSFPQSFNTNFPIAVSTHTTSNLRWADVAGTPGANSVSIRQWSSISGSSNLSTFVYAVGFWRSP
ncbi:hypothetical protein JCM9152_3990 [Halalkalibacter hemicellulosilyticusJCM 9152]|uniref:Phage minor structural protein n=2 Tax=Halalkalibacter TaxID=2893056 RepID=W4QK21_9BACI|nr:hypothetical protein JCM9152_3990 [Halalkalibacter hemicellulosilyticusJCM 9152]